MTSNNIDFYPTSRQPFSVEKRHQDSSPFFISFSTVYTNFRLPFLKSAWNLGYPGENHDVREMLRNLIGCLEDWELEKTVFTEN